MKLRLFAALLGAASLSACAQAQKPEDAKAASTPAASAVKSTDVDANVRKALTELNPQVSVDYIGPAALPGYREVIAGGQLVFVSDDGKYLIQGAVLDVANKVNLTDNSQALSKHRAKLLSEVPTAERIVFSPPNAKYTVSVFTDVECGYCRKLHSEIAEYNKQGIAIEYLAFPRMGLGTKDALEMEAVWCSADRKQALTDAKAGKPVPGKNCENPIAAQFNLGQRLGVNGTPAIFTANGQQLGGYLPPAQLRAALDAAAGSK